MNNKIINEYCIYCNNGYLVEDVCSRTGNIYYYCGKCLKYKEVKAEREIVEVFSPDNVDLDEYYKSLINKGED